MWPSHTATTHDKASRITLSYLCIFRPIGSGTCGNQRDATAVVSSLGMCASYAWSNGNAGFCVVSRTQCFTSVDFQMAYDAADKVQCAATGTMTCYGFATSKPAVRRLAIDLTGNKHVGTGTNRRAIQLTAVR